jgi:hypothetical protein
LQTVINHAERLLQLLVIYEIAPPREEWARVWTIGRAGEVQAVAEDVVARWRCGPLRAAAAAASLQGYLDELHLGLSTHLGCRIPSCCLAILEVTAPPPRT